MRKWILILLIISGCNLNKTKEYKTFYSDGSLKGLHETVDEKLNGKSKFYYRNGDVRSVLEYSDDKLWNVLEYYNVLGNKLDFGNFQNGYGKIKVYDIDEPNTLRLEGEVEGGYKVGNWYFYNYSGGIDTIRYDKVLFREDI